MFRSRLLASALGLSLCLGAAAPAAFAQTAQAAAQTAAPAAQDGRAAPSLIVTVVVDQLSANLFNQYRSQFTGGLKTLADQGMVSINGYQTHGVTVTCAGHSTVLTGAHPARSGIPANDPTQAQYQLWIVDPARDPDAPVDGGVFDIPADGSPVVIPIAAKLALNNPQAFVITLEQPGGVVKSKLEKVVALAKL